MTMAVSQFTPSPGIRPTSPRRPGRAREATPPGTERRKQAHCGPVLFPDGSWARILQHLPPGVRVRKDGHTAEELCPRAERRAPRYPRKTLLSPRTSRPAPAPTCCLAQRRDRTHVWAWVALWQAGSPPFSSRLLNHTAGKATPSPLRLPDGTFSGVCRAHSAGAELGAALLSPRPDTSG